MGFVVEYGRSPNPNLGTMGFVVEYGRSEAPAAEESELDPSVYIINFAECDRTDMSQEAEEYWKSLDDEGKEELSTVSGGELSRFSSRFVKEPWLVDFLSDAIDFFVLYGTWEMYLCPDPDCLRLFHDDESLIIHLKSEHLPEIHPPSCPPQRHNLFEEQRCADALRKMVWKPIVIEPALDMLSSMCLNYRHSTLADVCSGSDQLHSLNWPYSEDPNRKNLLVVLKKKFQILLAAHERASFSFLSDRFLTAMTALASKHIFVARPPRYGTQFLQELLACSPLSFCLLEADGLNWFVLLLEPMCQFVQQHTSLSANHESESEKKGYVSWNKSKILDIVSYSPDKCLFAFPKTEPLCDGERVTILSLLCHGPCIPKIPRVPSKAKESFSCVQKVFNELRECQTAGGPELPSANQALELVEAAGLTHQKSLSRPWHVWFQKLRNLYPDLNFCLGDPAEIESHSQSEQKHLQLVNRVLCLESWLRELCALDCRMYILPLMKSFLRLKLYFYLRCHRLEMREDNLSAQCPRIPDQEECTEQQVSSDESESEYDSEKPWRAISTLCTLDSTLSESATGNSEGSGPFFWVSISDVLRHREKNSHGSDGSEWDGIRWFRLNQTWKYWICYDCGITFVDRESHMVHLENEHQLSIGHNEYWLIPRQGSRDEVKGDAAMMESDLEDSITVDDTYDYFLVDSNKFYEMPSTDEERELGQEKHKRYLNIVPNIQNQVSHLTQLIQIKCETLTYLEVANAFDLMLFHGGQPLSLLVSWLRKLSILDWRIGTTNQRSCPCTLSTVEQHIGTTHKLQFLFLSQLLYKAHDQGYGSLSNNSVLEAFQDMKSDLISELSSINQKILGAADQIDNMKRCLSDLCVCDYRTKIVPSVRSFLHAKFNFDDSLRSFECKNVKDCLSSIDQSDIEDLIDSFQVEEVLSPGKVVINAVEKSSLSWAFAFIGIHLRFNSQWSFMGSTEKLDGCFKFGGWFKWGHTFGGSGVVTAENYAAVASLIRDSPEYSLSTAVSSKLLLLKDMYGKQTRRHGCLY